MGGGKRSGTPLLYQQCTARDVAENSKPIGRGVSTAMPVLLSKFKVQADANDLITLSHSRCTFLSFFRRFVD